MIVFFMFIPLFIQNDRKLFVPIRRRDGAADARKSVVIAHCTIHTARMQAVQ